MRITTTDFLKWPDHFCQATMSQEPTDISMDSLLRMLERHYAYHAARLFRANRIPEPRRLAEPARPEPSVGMDVPPRQPDPAISE